MSEKQTATWKIALGYAAFSVAAFLFFFYVTFPFDTIRARLVSEAAVRGYDLQMASLGPGLFGVTARDVEIRKRDVAPPTPGAGEAQNPPQALEMDAIALRPSIFPLGVAFRASALGGTATGAVGGLDRVAVRADLDELDLSRGNLEGFTGLKLSGTISGQIDLEIPRVSAGGKGPPEPDLGAASGEVVLNGAEVTINGGTMTLPYMGQPTPMDLPKIIFGDLEGKLVIEKGQATLEQLRAKSSDLTLMGSGTMKLARRLEYSESNLEFRFKPEDDLKTRLGPISFALNMIPTDPKDPSFKLITLSGFIGKPRSNLRF